MTVVLSTSDWVALSGSEVVLDTKSGDWGSAEPGDDLIAVRTLRGTDFEQAANGVIGEAPVRYLTAKRLGARRLVEGDLLVEMSGGSKAQATGRALLVTPVLLESAPSPLGFSNFVKRVRVRTELVDADFFELQWIAKYRAGRTRIYERRTTGIRNFKLDAFLENEEFLLPPLPEQRAIAHLLRTVQQAKEATEQVIAAAQELKKSLMRYLFTYGPVDALQAPRVETDETEIGLLPSHWDVVPFGQLFTIQQGKAMSKAARRGLSPRPFLRTANVYWGRLELDQLDTMDFTYREQQRFELRQGDVLVCEGGAYAGRAAMWAGELEGCHYQNHLHRCRAISRDVSPTFIVSWLETAWTIRSLYGGTRNTSAIPNISKSRLAAYPVPKAPSDEERRIVEMLESVNRKIASEDDRRDALAALFDSLLHNLMTARLRVTDLEVPA